MAGGPRDYSSGTEKALFRLSSGTCYFPDCTTPIIRTIEGHPVVEVEIAHIRGANKNSARFDPSMDDAERSAFANLILLCTVHHKLVDRISPEKYPVEVLRSWKVLNEAAEGIEALRQDVTAANFEALLERIAGSLTLKRTVELDLLAGFVVSSTDIATVPPDSFDVVLRHNPHMADLTHVMVSNIRNVGSQPVGIEAVDLYFGLQAHDGSEGEASFTLLGRNDFGASNPLLPCRLQDGAAVRWLTKMETVRYVAKTATENGSNVLDLRSRVRLSTGEVIDSIKVPWPFKSSWD
ncbi:hypothetical protein SAMN06295879_3574 [Agreia bicolorata]|uniref:HNH endonuclease n=1 Tax=Agreia bicolorata TaxID=110935 RepID=A0A1T4YLR7_9MICO|nr:hypothetical protein SAMN06295879_3574 [Agreia bicolorata]